MTNKSLEENVVLALKKKGWRVATAESCTGGMAASSLVNVSGASEVFQEGYITYSNEAKHRLLGVEEEALQSFGAVSSQVAVQMAQGAARAAGTEAGISTTGIAGPLGGTKEKPVGLVYIACCVRDSVWVKENHFKGTRMEIRQQAARMALEMLWNALEQTAD